MAWAISYFDSGKARHHSSTSLKTRLSEFTCLEYITPLPIELPPGFYWYGTKRHSPGGPPKWLQCLLDRDFKSSTVSQEVEEEPETTPAVDPLSAEHSPSVDETHRY